VRQQTPPSYRPPHLKGEPLFNLPPIVVAILALTVGVHVCLSYFLVDEARFALIWHLSFVPALFAADFSFTSLLSVVSYSFLHGSWLHLSFNMIWFVIFGAPLANRIGAGRFLLLWILTAILAALTHLALHDGSTIPMIGASGAVSGIMGAAARYGLHREPLGNRPQFSGRLLPVSHVFRERNVMVFITIWLVGNLASGLYSYLPEAGLSAIAWEAHIGGLVAGFFAIGLLDKTGYE